MGWKVRRRPRDGTRRGARWLALAVAVAVSSGASQPAQPPQNAPPPVTTAAPAAAAAVPDATAVTRAARPGHVFMINLENRGYGTVWGPASKAPYLSKFLRARGVLLSQYYAIAHHSLPNYL